MDIGVIQRTQRQIGPYHGCRCSLHCQDISSHVIYYIPINHNHIYVMAAHNQGSSYSKIFIFPAYKILHFSIHFRYHLEENFTKNTWPIGRFSCPRCHWAMWYVARLADLLALGNQAVGYVKPYTICICLIMSKQWVGCLFPVGITIIH